MTEKYRWNHGVEMVSLDDEWIILHPTKQTITRLNEVGEVVWNVLQHPSTLEDIVSTILTQYNVTEAEAKSDVSQFLEQLKKSGLIDVVI